jgi:hypothetical protein
MLIDIKKKKKKKKKTKKVDSSRQYCVLYRSSANKAIGFRAYHKAHHCFSQKSPFV